MKELIELLPTISLNDATVLIHGESGTGKSLLAEQIHRNSRRASNPFVKVDCIKNSSEIIERSLFGFMSGSDSDKWGAFLRADGGTLVLEGITKMDIANQTRLLKYLKEKTIHPIGSSKPIQTDVRILATTERPLLEAIREGSFRKDLYYRLNVFHLQIPPLRYRSDDIAQMARRFVNQYSHRYDLPKKRLSDNLLSYLKQLEWRGNVRQLDNLLHRAVLQSGSANLIDRTHLENELEFADSESGTDTD